MGMDLNIYSARNREVFKHDGWWESDQVGDEFYARKFWDLVENCSFIPYDYESGDFIELSLENLEEMIRVACKYRDYFDTYNNIPLLCELRDKYREWQENEDPRKLFLEYDW